MGKFFKMSFKVKVLQEMAIGLNINDSERMDPRVHMPPSRGNIHVHVYFHNIQTSSPLKPLGQSKPDFNETWHEVSMTQVLQCIYKS